MGAGLVILLFTSLALLPFWPGHRWGYLPRPITGGMLLGSVGLLHLLTAL